MQYNSYEIYKTCMRLYFIQICIADTLGENKKKRVSGNGLDRK